MAKRKQNPWLPSGGVLVVAVVSAVLAAILVNVYLSYVKSSYEEGAKAYLQLKRDVAKGKVIEVADVRVVRIPRPLLETGAFEYAIEAGERDSLVRGNKARRKMYEGEFLFSFDFLSDSGERDIEPPPQGYEMMTIRITPDPLLRPGAYVTIRGRFDLDPDEKKERIEPLDVLYNVQIKAVGGVTSGESTKRAADNLQIVLRQSMVKQLQQIREVMYAKQFVVTTAAPPPGVGRTDAKFGTEVLSLIERGAPAPRAASSNQP